MSYFLTTLNVSSSASASLLVLRSTGTSCIRDNILAAAFLLASFFEVPLPKREKEREYLSNAIEKHMQTHYAACIKWYLHFVQGFSTDLIIIPDFGDFLSMFYHCRSITSL